MINYDDRYKTLFRNISGDIDILNRIKGVRVDITGDIDDTRNTRNPMSVILTGIVNRSEVTEFTMDISAPLVGVSKTITATNGSYQDENISIHIDYSDIHIGSYNVRATVLLRNIMVTPERKISLLGSTPSMGACLEDGINTKATYSNDTLIITGGPGLGKGLYQGSKTEHTSGQYAGLLSINGARLGRNIDIKMSDLLTSYGGRVYEEKKLQPDTE